MERITCICLHHLMKGDNDDMLVFPITGNIIVKLLNWTEDSGHVEKIIQFDESIPLKCRQRVTDGEMATDGLGYGQFISHHDLETNQGYLHNDMMCFSISFEDIQQTS